MVGTQYTCFVYIIEHPSHKLQKLWEWNDDCNHVFCAFNTFEYTNVKWENQGTQLTVRYIKIWYSYRTIEQNCRTEFKQHTVQSRSFLIAIPRNEFFFLYICIVLMTSVDGRWWSYWPHFCSLVVLIRRFPLYLRVSIVEVLLLNLQPVRNTSFNWIVLTRFESK